MLALRSMRGEVAFWAFVAASAVFAALCSLHPMYEGDAFWHMTLGRTALELGARSFPEPSAFQAFDAPAFAPEWLWGVITYLAYRVGGESLVSALPALAAVACVGALALPISRLGGGLAARALVLALSVVVALSRMRLRPQLACLVLMPLTLWLCMRYRERLERRWAALLIAVELLWAQLHGSFVLMPAIFVLAVAPAVWDRARERREALGTLVLLLLGLLSSAYGIEVLGYLFAHAGGDATKHIADMSPPEWSAFNPLQTVYGSTFALLLLLGLAGALRERRWPWPELALAALTVALGARSTRFLAETASLTIPLAMLGARSLCAPSALLPALAAAALVVGSYARVAHKIARDFAPLGELGFAADVVPRAGLRVLSTLPRGANVLSSYSVGGALGFFSHGHVRTYVDGRTPLYFDDTDYALSRDAFASAAAMARALERHDARAIVVERWQRSCELVPSGFVVAALDSGYTTFTRGGDALRWLAPCGGELLRPQACAHPAELASDIRRLRALGAGVMAELAQAASALQCGREPLAVLDLPELAGTTWEAFAHRLEALQELRLGHPERALAVLREQIARGDLGAYDLLAPHLLALEPAELRAVLEPLTRTLDDATPGRVRALLALVCMRQGDAECARFHGLRAALSGEQEDATRVVLAWLSTHHPAPRVRADARAWLEARATEPPQQGGR